MAARRIVKTDVDKCYSLIYTLPAYVQSRLRQKVNISCHLITYNSNNDSLYFQLSREDDAHHLGKILEGLAPFYIRNLNLRCLQYINSIHPVKHLLENSPNIQELVICGTKTFPEERRLFMGLTNITEIGLVLEDISQGPVKVDLFRLFFSNQEFPEVISQLAFGKECKVTFPHLERLGIVGCINQNTRYFFFSLLHKYNRLVTNLLHCCRESRYTKEFLHFSKVGEDTAHIMCSREIFPRRIQNQCGVEYIFYEFIEENIC